MLRPKLPDLFTVGDDLPPALTVADAINDLPPVASGKEITCYTLPPRNDYQRERRSEATSLSMHASTRHTPKMLEIIRHSGPNISSVPAHLITSGFSSCYSRLEADEPAPTITVNFVHPASNKCIHPTQDRALTVREGARLQSFDDTFLFAGKNRSLIAKQIGNAVPPLLGRAIAAALANVLDNAPLQTV
jgi:DNA (cytosine-5)-methyltransferase 1